MLLTQTVRLKLNKSEKEIVENLCHLSKNLFNVGLYTVRQYFFQENKYLSYESNYHLCKKNENYQLLATDCGQQTLKYVDRCFKAFFRESPVERDDRSVGGGSRQCNLFILNAINSTISFFGKQ
jgi:hypothetical protein